MVNIATQEDDTSASTDSIPSTSGTAVICSTTPPPQSSCIEETGKIGSDPALLCCKQLSDEERRNILCPENKLPLSFKYPKNSQDRRYNRSWEDTFPWLSYSASVDGAYCAACIAFQDPSDERQNPEFVQVPFRDWKNAMGEKRGRLKIHAHSERHLKALEMRDSFLAISNMEKPAVTQSISKARSDKIERNRAALTSIIDIIITLGKRNIAFRGNWNKEISEEDGNFMFFINWKATFDETFKRKPLW